MSTGLRIGDAERDAAVTALGEHFAAGRLDKEEFDERTADAWTARTAGDLGPLFADLPAPHPASTDPPATTVTRTGPASWPMRPSRPHLWWFGVARLAVLTVLVALAVAGQILWFVAAIMIWLWCAGTGRTRWHHSRRHPWHHHRGWNHPVRR